MRNITRTTALAAILATTLTATPLLAANTPSRPRKDRGSVTEMIRQVLKTFFGVSTQGDISIPVPSSSGPNTAPPPAPAPGE